MTNTIAFVLACLIGLAILLDLVLTGGDTLLFLGKRMFELLQWLAFWR